MVHSNMTSRAGRARSRLSPDWEWRMTAVVKSSANDTAYVDTSDRASMSKSPVAEGSEENDPNTD